MKTNFSSIAFFFGLLCSSFNARADVRLPAVISDHMVLQQNAQVMLWGWCEPNEKIKIKTGWDTTTYTATGTAVATWRVQLPTPAAGGPYTINIEGNNRLKIEDVLVGEVWLCSGQSNMEMNINWGIKTYDADVAAATNKSIRFFHVPKTTASYPQDDVRAKWVVCTPEEMKRFSTVGYFFGQQLQQRLNAPVGLINASWGGTPAEVWTPAELVTQNAVLKVAATKLNTSKSWPIAPGLAYNAMIFPLTSYTIAGALWYQGESNVGTADTYAPLLTTLIQSWRKDWAKELPFYFVQIAPYAGYGKTSNSSSLLREAQTSVLAVPQTGMVVTSDLVDNINDIHPHNKKDVGLRLANYALVNTYNKKGIAYQSPVYKSMKVEKDKIRIYFDGAEKGLMSRGGAPAEFYIAGEDKVFIPAKAKIEGNTVVVSASGIKKPVAVRFGFTNAAMPNLFSKEGLPVNLLRTDNWPVNTIVAEK